VIIVGIPGTSSDQDAWTDFDFKFAEYESPNVNCEDCLVHHGFLEAWNSLAPVVSDELSKALDANPGYSTVVSGHSLGGALAALAFASLVNGPFNVTAAYTYGEPRTGNSDFANYIDSLSGASDTEAGIFYRVTHANGM
jgi:predicted lipase